MLLKLRTKALTERHPLAVSAAAAATILLWGGTPIANKIALDTIDSATAGILRSLLAGLIAGALAFAWRLPFPTEARPRFLLALSGIANFAVWPLFLSLGLQLTTASHAALIIAMIPAFTGLIAAVVDRRWPQLLWWIGVSIAAAGTVYLITLRVDLAPGRNASATALGDLVILTGVVACAGGYVAGGKLAPVIGTWATTFWGLGVTAVVLVPVVGLLAHRTDWAAVDASGWLAIAYMTVLSSLIGYVLWFWALGHGGIARMSSWQLGQPLVSVVFAVLVLGEAVTLPLLLAGGLIVAGAALTQLRPSAAAARSTTEVV